MSLFPCMVILHCLHYCSDLTNTHCLLCPAVLLGKRAALEIRNPRKALLGYGGCPGVGDAAGGVFACRTECAVHGDQGGRHVILLCLHPLEAVDVPKAVSSCSIIFGHWSWNRVAEEGFL